MTIDLNQFIADYEFRHMDIQHYSKEQINVVGFKVDSAENRPAGEKSHTPA